MIYGQYTRRVTIWLLEIQYVLRYSLQDTIHTRYVHAYTSGMYVMQQNVMILAFQVTHSLSLQWWMCIAIRFIFGRYDICVFRGLYLDKHLCTGVSYTPTISLWHILSNENTGKRNMLSKITVTASPNDQLCLRSFHFTLPPTCSDLSYARNMLNEYGTTFSAVQKDLSCYAVATCGIMPIFPCIPCTLVGFCWPIVEVAGTPGMPGIPGLPRGWPPGTWD